MSTFYRRDDWVQDKLGNAQSGVNVYVCSQPANTHVIPPSPLIQLYSDPAGANPITQPAQTDADGHAYYYAAQGIYTIVYYSPYIQQVVLTDQIIVQPDGTIQPQFNLDSTADGSMSGAVNGVNTAFTLSSTPASQSSLIIMVNGVIIFAYAYSEPTNTIILENAPNPGSVVSARYETIIES